MEKKDFDILEDADEEIADEMSRKYVFVTESEKERMFRKIQKKTISGNIEISEFETKVEGTDIYKGSIVSKFLSYAAVLVLLLGLGTGHYFIVKNFRHDMTASNPQYNPEILKKVFAEAGEENAEVPLFIPYNYRSDEEEKSKSNPIFVYSFEDSSVSVGFVSRYVYENWENLSLNEVKSSERYKITVNKHEAERIDLTFADGTASSCVMWEVNNHIEMISMKNVPDAEIENIIDSIT